MREIKSRRFTVLHESSLARLVVMKKVILSVLTISLMSCLASPAPAVDRMRIERLDPSTIDPGSEFVIRGGNFSCSGDSYTLHTRVQMHPGSRFTHAIDLPQSVTLYDMIKARVPRAIPPGEYTIYVVTTSASGRLLCRSNPVTLTVRQPAPPTRSADPFQVINNPCAARTGGAQDARSPSCPYPMRRIWVNENLDNRTIYPAGRITISGIGQQDQDAVIAILRAEQIDAPRGQQRNRYYVAKLMRVIVRTYIDTTVLVPPDLETGTYRVAALYRHLDENYTSIDRVVDAFGGRRPGMPVYVMGSNVTSFEVVSSRDR